MVSSRQSPGSEHGVGVMLAAGCSLVTRSRFAFLFSLSFANRLATIYASRLLQLHIFTLPYLLSLNSLDREGARLLSPCGTQITITPDAGAYISAQMTQPSSRRSSMKILYFVLFRSS